VSALPFAEWMAVTQDRAESALGRFLPGADSIPARLHQAMRYATLGGGKRVRPLLAFAAGELTDAQPEALDIVGCAVEMIHAYSLVHDDLPAKDRVALERAAGQRRPGGEVSPVYCHDKRPVQYGSPRLNRPLVG